MRLMCAQLEFCQSDGFGGRVANGDTTHIYWPLTMPVTIAPSDVLDGDLDETARATRVPDSYSVKGMFFSRLKDRLGDLWQEALPMLEAPPRLGHYIPFKDYPQRDYLTLCTFIAVRCYPGRSPREGMRRLARDDFDVFANSAFGRITLATVGDTRSALLMMASVYNKVATGDWEVRSTEVDERTVRMEWTAAYGSWEYQLGQLEGLLRHFASDYRITFSMPEPQHLCFDVEYS